MYSNKEMTKFISAYKLLKIIAPNNCTVNISKKKMTELAQHRCYSCL